MIVFKMYNLWTASDSRSSCDIGTRYSLMMCGAIKSLELWYTQFNYYQNCWWPKTEIQLTISFLNFIMNSWKLSWCTVLDLPILKNGPTNYTNLLLAIEIQLERCSRTGQTSQLNLKALRDTAGRKILFRMIFNGTFGWWSIVITVFYLDNKIRPRRRFQILRIRGEIGR